MPRRARPHACPACGKAGMVSKPYWNQNGNKSYQLVEVSTGTKHTGPGSDGSCTGQRQKKQAPQRQERQQHVPRKEEREVPRTEGPKGIAVTEHEGALLETLRVMMRDGINRTDVQGMIDQALAGHPGTKRTIVMPDKREFDIQDEHKDFEGLCRRLLVRDELSDYVYPLFLKGRAGSGKTTALAHAAEAIGLPFYAQSVTEQMTVLDIMGYTNATGGYVATSDFAKAYEHGGCFLWDEMDKGNPNTNACIQSAIENGWCRFPHKMITRHRDFIALGAGNTYGTGADAIYVGSNTLDGAYIDRFTYMDWDYDEKFERQLAGNDEWVDHVIALRKKADKLKLRVVISPRASIRGAAYLKHGFKRAEVEEMCVWKGISSTDRRQIEREAA